MPVWLSVFDTVYVSQVRAAMMRLLINFSLLLSSFAQQHHLSAESMDHMAVSSDDKKTPSHIHHE